MRSGLSKELSDRLQKLQNRAARVITKTNYETRSSHLLETLKWDSLAIRRDKQMATLMFKTIRKRVPTYLQNLFDDKALNYDLLNQQHTLSLPKPRTEYLKQSFSYSGALLWNSLPPTVKKAKTISQFKRNIQVLL